MSIQERLAHIQESIRQHAGKQPVTLVAVSKYATIEQMREAYEAGVRHFGENKVQDALTKMVAFPAEFQQNVHWHFIGNLQSNKVNKTLGRFDYLHAIDSVSLSEAISKANIAKDIRQPILLQVNSTPDPSRHGFQPDQIRSALEQILPMPGIEVRGLMTMAPAEASVSGDVSTLQSIFCGLKDLRDQLKAEFAIDLPDLSMGMSHDYVHALECGATIIRIGNSLFKN